MAAGALSPEAAVKLATERGRLMQQCPSGAMISLTASVETVTPWLTDGAGVVAMNGVRRTVVGGTAAAVAQVEAAAKQLGGVRVTPLRVSHAFHSPLLAPMVTEFRAFAAQFSFSPLQLPFYSTVTGEQISHLDADYFARQITAPVQFLSAVEVAQKNQSYQWLEIGSNATLTILGQEISGDWWASLSSNPTQHLEDLGRALGRLYSLGANPNWATIYPMNKRPLDAPHYAFQRQRHSILDDFALQDTPTTAALSPCEPVLKTPSETLPLPPPTASNPSDITPLMQQQLAVMNDLIMRQLTLIKSIQIGPQNDE